jgi:hypothetical protein
MIRYALACAAGHEFEGWFSQSGDYDSQRDRGLLTCPVCDSHEVNKQIMAPAVAGRSRETSETTGPAKRAVMMEMMGQIRRHVENNFDYVGDAFAKEARAIHGGASEARGIYGEATPAEVKALEADGVPIAPLPPEPPKKTELN